MFKITIEITFLNEILQPKTITCEAETFEHLIKRRIIKSTIIDNFYLLEGAIKDSKIYELISEPRVLAIISTATEENGEYLNSDKNLFVIDKESEKVYLAGDLDIKNLASKFMLISVADRNISYSFFDSYPNAYAEMEKEFKKSSFNIKEQMEDGMAKIEDNSAWTTDGSNHDDYDWLIVKLDGGILNG